MKNQLYRRNMLKYFIRQLYLPIKIDIFVNMIFNFAKENDFHANYDHRDDGACFNKITAMFKSNIYI